MILKKETPLFYQLYQEIINFEFTWIFFGGGNSVSSIDLNNNPFIKESKMRHRLSKSLLDLTIQHHLRDLWRTRNPSRKSYFFSQPDMIPFQDLLIDVEKIEFLPQSYSRP